MPDLTSSGRPTRHLVSVNVGLPRIVERHGHTVSTGIFKTPVTGRVPVRRLNLEGDGQADLSVHGGPGKAVYGYPGEHYTAWRRWLEDSDLPWGAFGENLTTAGLLEDEVCIGDRFRIDSVELVVTQPRLPCSKLALKFDRPGIVEELVRSRRCGFYFSVARAGELGAGDPIEVVDRDPRRLTIAEVARLKADLRDDRDLLARAADHPGLPESWRESFRSRLER